MGCWVFDSDMRVRTAATGSYVYPDVSVVCGKPLFHQNQSDILTNPILVAEVLSPSTENYDKGKKFDLYREVESFREYLLVSTDSAHLAHFSRQSDKTWVLREATGSDSSLFIPALSLNLDLANLYAGVFDLPR
jgi:Uma2 family endonuclease